MTAPTFELSLFARLNSFAGSILFPNQDSCQSRKTAKILSEGDRLGDFANQDLAGFANSGLGTFASRGASNPRWRSAGERRMIGKILGAWIGAKIAGSNKGARGAFFGAGTAALAKRAVPTLAALAFGGWAFRKWGEQRRAHAPYPDEATPRIPASETKSPS